MKTGLTSETNNVVIIIQSLQEVSIYPYVVPLGFEDNPTAARTLDASGEEAGWL